MVNIDEFSVPDITPAKTINIKVLDESMQPALKAKFIISANDGEEKEYETDKSGNIPVIVGENEGGTKLKIIKIQVP